MIELLYSDDVAEAAEAFGLDTFLVTAMVMKESSGNRMAFNPEPEYRYLWDLRKKAPFRPLTAEEDASEVPPPDFSSPYGIPVDAEWWGQQMSWGLMQVMGAVAREYGFAGQFFTELCFPQAAGLLYGCKYFKRCLERAGGKVPLALCVYNGGPGKLRENPPSNQSYAEAVIALWAKAKA